MMILRPHSGLGRFCIRLGGFGEFIGPVTAPKKQTKTNPIAQFVLTFKRFPEMILTP
jgi:hypothetical protein